MRISARSMRAAIKACVFSSIGTATTVIPASYLSGLLGTGTARDFYAAAVFAGLVIPLIAWAAISSLSEQKRSHAAMVKVEQQLSEAIRVAEVESERREVQVRRQKFESRLANALEMAEGPPLPHHSTGPGICRAISTTRSRSRSLSASKT